MFGDKIKKCDICGAEFNSYELERVSNTVTISFQYQYNYSNKYSALVCSKCKNKLNLLKVKPWGMEAWNTYRELQNQTLPDNAKELIESYVPENQTFEEVQQEQKEELTKFRQHQQYMKSQRSKYRYNISVP